MSHSELHWDSLHIRFHSFASSKLAHIWKKPMMENMFWTLKWSLSWDWNVIFKTAACNTYNSSGSVKIGTWYCSIKTDVTQPDCYGPLQYFALLHSYCTGTYTEVVVVLLWNSFTFTLTSTPTELLCRYYMVKEEILHRSSAVTSV